MQVIDVVGAREQNWATFLSSLPKQEPRMCVFDLEFTSNDGMNCSRLFFCYWLPDGTPLKLKLTYATFKESFKTKLDIGGK
jgi:cofilin